MLLIICGLVIVFFVNNLKIFICFWDFNVEYSIMLRKNIVLLVLFIFLFLKFDYYCFFNNNYVVVVD